MEKRIILHWYTFNWRKKKVYYCIGCYANKYKLAETKDKITCKNCLKTINKKIK